MDRATLDWLRSRAGADALAEAAASIDAGAEELAVGTALRRTLPAERAASVVAQMRLRRRAVAKFGADAERMWFTAEALEQATRRSVADHRAARPALAAAADGRQWSLVDLGCGLGGDLIAVARHGLLTAGVDLDPLRAGLASANLEDLGLAGAVRVAAAEDVDVRRFDVALCDPARRDGSGRTWSRQAWSPPWTFIESLLAGAAVVKAAPGLPHGAVPDGVEAEFVSDAGALKEASLWSGPLATARRRATLLTPGAKPITITDEEDPGPEAIGLAEVGTYLHEPDDAVIRAGLVTAVAALLEAQLVDPHLAYLTSDVLQPSPLARSFRVREEAPFREKQLRSFLRARGIGRLTIKKRGVQISPEQLRPRLSLRGDAEATLVLTRTPRGSRAFMVDRIEPASVERGTPQAFPTEPRDFSPEQ